MARFGFRTLLSLLAVFAVMSLVVVEADARVGGGMSSGSRGGRTFSAPPSTSTAPSSASPFQRSATQPSRPTTPATSPATGMGSRSGLFGGGLLGGLAAGFIGAGLFGLLFGHGFFGGLGGLGSFLGLLLQIGLVVIVARFAWAWWQRRQQQQQPAYASGPSMHDNSMGGSPTGSNGSYGGGLFGGAGGGNTMEQDTGTPIEIGAQDYDAFEHLLGEIQQAWSNEDLNAMRRLATPEMVSYFSEDLSNNASRGVVNKASDVKLLQGDLAEAWREDDAEYATVAMRFSLVDQTIERASGRMVEGSTAPMEAVELWTFRRVPGGQWMLAAIQQT
jgi:predicted lipid-binding transport protein (Tim44 family)